MPFIETREGVRLFYRDWGNGQPVVFIHGWGLGADMWEYQMLALSDADLRCIAYDQRGCGRSDDPGHGYDFDTLADDLAALIERLDLREVTLVSYSMGAGTVARYLSRHGTERIVRTALIAPTTPFLRKTENNPEGVDKEYFDAIIAELERDRPRYLTASAPAFFGVGLPGVAISPEILQWGVGLAMAASPKATREMFRASSETDYRPDMPSFTVPTLIIHGDSDTNAPLDMTGRRTAHLILNSRFVVYTGAAHGLFITEKERLNDDLRRFIRGE
jgi:pimeloyl-ACP methyl ester carboxylesterase